ncbi:purine or other phosphorylase family 1 [Denitrovibrio acetiphilus DSM 12809]|uniref:Probable S-methyl-5'-thioinosine phosphorylase n=1 Tax=Denitrovibrio acetiphilus (strain DSM 12809 / NBRC 114555 / N2460) TaxID=522772 RepID=D4H3W4_DENA2|nr:S-methyl-5'-thioinosine phosphorylase [Denitrovibrio acetiphilus]ADD67275.1 purine or other phosphorylase family 1 [Denitrovibrio acetiphilus DSM 12809]
MKKLGIIGGSGLYDIEGFEYVEEIIMQTEYGDPSDTYRVFSYKDMRFYFLNRHGRSHSVPPHKVNYRANIDGFSRLGIENIVSITATGGINSSYKPGDIIIPDDGIDMTSGRIQTFYESKQIHHIDFTEPFCPRLRGILENSAESADVDAAVNGTYVCTNGPRMETKGEIKAFDRWGADLVGMTLFPECSLARERELCYANLSVITNYAAGTSSTKLTADEVVEEMGKATEKLKGIVSMLPVYFKNERECSCPDALAGTKISK